MTKRDYGIESIERAFDIHKGKGSLLSWRRSRSDGSLLVPHDPPGDLAFTKSPRWFVEYRNYNSVVVNLKEAHVLCIGLARGFEAGRLQIVSERARYREMLVAAGVSEGLLDIDPVPAVEFDGVKFNPQDGPFGLHFHPQEES